MTNIEWIDMFRVIPEHEHSKLVIVLLTGMELSVDTLLRFETNFLVLRGRVAGTVDEARGFFVPYAQMLCFRLERTMKLEELTAFFPKAGAIADAVTPTKEEPALTRSSHPTPVAPTDPATASRLLLEKIRATRASSASRYNSRHENL